MLYVSYTIFLQQRWLKKRKCYENYEGKKLHYLLGGKNVLVRRPAEFRPALFNGQLMAKAAPSPLSHNYFIFRL